MLKKPNELTGCSGFISQHVMPTCYCMQNDLDEMKRTYSVLEGFSSYNSRRNLHADEEQDMLCLQLPKLFFNNALTLLKKHFNQWRSEKTFKTLFISKPETSSNIAQWYLGMPSSEGSIWYDFLKRTMHVPSFINFATELVSVQVLQQQSFMKEHRRGILLLACNTNMHVSNEPEVVRLRKYCLETFLPMFTNAQNVESSTKDTASTKATGKEEDMTSMIAMMRSCLLQPITALTKMTQIAHTIELDAMRRLENSLKISIA